MKPYLPPAPRCFLAWFTFDRENGSDMTFDSQRLAAVRTNQSFSIPFFSSADARTHFSSTTVHSQEKLAS
jgi:hypothetical protein